MTALKTLAGTAGFLWFMASIYGGVQILEFMMVR